MAIVFGSPEAKAILDRDKKLNAPITTVELMLCVNDDRNGMHTGRVDGIDLHDGAIALALRGLPLVCRLVGGILQVGRVKVKAITYQTWVGNWCWDSARVSLEDAALVLNYLRKREWDCEMGYVDLSNLYESLDDITADDLAELLQR